MYIDETGRTRLEKPKKEVENITTRRFTREQKRDSGGRAYVCNTDHADRNNCIIDREEAKVIYGENNINTRWIKEDIWIRKTTLLMNRDEG